VTRYRIPPRYFHEMIDGVASDLEPRRFETFDQLYRYCYQVASTAGLTTIHILGFDSPDALPLAEKCGIAFQLTNILRDIREDADAAASTCPPKIWPASRNRRRHSRRRAHPGIHRSDGFRDRPRAPVLQGIAAAVGPGPPPQPGVAGALISIYSRLLDRIERSNYDVFTRRISLPAAEKCWIVVKALFHGGRA
jgi:15-cis-phytoene synthase